MECRVVKSLVIDFGASNGRAMICTYEVNKFTMQEVHRFANDPVTVNGVLYWDVLRLFHEIKCAILKAKEVMGCFPDSIGIDTWGASFALLDKDGDLIANPMHYRNQCVLEYSEEMESIIDRESMFEKLGYYPTIVFNAYHLYYIKKKKPELLRNAAHFINISDLFNYFLTGRIVSEKTIAAPSLLYSIKNSRWDNEVIEKFGFAGNLFEHDLVEPGTIIGSLSVDICDELNIDKDIKVIAVAGHDTTSASVSLPVQDVTKKFAYLSCGTWSVLGAETLQIRPTKHMFNEEITFDEGVLGTKHIRKNINGLWILQECKRYWGIQGRMFSFSDLEKLASEAEPFLAYINVTDSIFFTSGNMPKKIEDFIRKTEQTIPKTIGEFCRIITESLAFKYKEYLSKIEEALGYQIEEVYMVGGGIQNRTLCQFTANALNRKVYAGPVEATVVGNLMMQGLALGIVTRLDDIRTLVNNSSKIDVYLPTNTDKWNRKYKHGGR